MKQEWKAQYKLALKEATRTFTVRCNLTASLKAGLDLGMVRPRGSGFHLAPLILLFTLPLVFQQLQIPYPHCNTQREKVSSGDPAEERSLTGISQKPLQLSHWLKLDGVFICEEPIILTRRTEMLIS